MEEKLQLILDAACRCEKDIRGLSRILLANTPEAKMRPTVNLVGGVLRSNERVQELARELLKLVRNRD